MSILSPRRKKTYLRRAVDRNIGTSSRQNQSDSHEHSHDKEPNRPVPQVEDLGERHVRRGGHDARHDRDDRNQGVGFKSAGHVGRQVCSDGGLESVDEVYEPHPVIASLSAVVFSLGRWVGQDRAELTGYSPDPGMP